MVKPTSGQIVVGGYDIIARPKSALHLMNFESPYVDLPKRLTVLENLKVYANLYRLDRINERIAKLVDELDLGQFLKRHFGTLSAGQKTRVALAKALINDPKILLLDEPTASLDPDSADWIRGYLKSYQSDHSASILLASHNMQEVERMCDHVLMMSQGKIVDAGSPAALIERYGRETMEEVFLDIARGRQTTPSDQEAMAQLDKQTGEASPSKQKVS